MYDFGRQKFMIVLYIVTAFCLNPIVSSVESNEVIFYEDPYFSGYPSNHSLKPGMIQLSYDYFDMHTSSIEVGSDVKVAVFRHLGFSGPSKIFEKSTNYVGDYWNDEIKSFIVIPKDQAVPLGVKMSDTAPNTVTGYEPVSQFFPAPDYLGIDEYPYEDHFLNLLP